MHGLGDLHAFDHQGAGGQSGVDLDQARVLTEGQGRPQPRDKFAAQC